MTIVTDTIAAEIALLERIEPTPVAPYGYGRDLSCVTDITETLDEVDQFSRTALSQALLRRLQTPRGSLPDDPDYGIDLLGMVNRGVTIDRLNELSEAVRAELRKDDRVENVEVRIAAPNWHTINASVRVTPVDPRLGDFTLTFGVTSGTFVVEELG